MDFTLKRAIPQRVISDTAVYAWIIRFFPELPIVAAYGALALRSPREAGAIEFPRPSAHEALYDHPLVSLCIIILLCLLCIVLYLSRKKIKASERRYRALFQDNGAIMILVDPVSLRIMDANPAACAFYGWRPADLLNMRIVDITTSPEEVVRDIYHDVINYERRRFRTRHRLSSGNEREMEVNAMPYGIDGKECILSILHDLTNERNESGRTP